MRTILAAVSAAAAALALAASPASAASVLNAGVNSQCGKATCFNDKGVFTQTWSAKDFSGPMTISQLMLDRGVLGSMDGSMFKLSFMLNGQEFTWGNYMMAGIAGDELSFWGANFTWDPADGDLVLVLAITPPPKPGAGGGGSFFSPAHANFGPDDSFGDGSNTEDGGPGDERPAAAAAAVPEPTAWALMIGGFGMAGAMLRRRRPAVVRAQP
jgi:hypothetical protein